MLQIASVSTGEGVETRTVSYLLDSAISNLGYPTEQAHDGRRLGRSPIYKLPKSTVHTVDSIFCIV